MSDFVSCRGVKHESEAIRSESPSSRACRQSETALATTLIPKPLFRDFDGPGDDDWVFAKIVRRRSRCNLISSQHMIDPFADAWRSEAAMRYSKLKVRLFTRRNIGWQLAQGECSCRKTST